MQFSAKARNIRFSPFKLRPLVDVIRGKGAQFALEWLQTTPLKRTVPISKLLASAVANAKNKQGVASQDLRIKDIRVDHGPTHRYYKPGAMGRANVQKKRFSHISVVLEIHSKEEKARGGSKG